MSLLSVAWDHRSAGLPWLKQTGDDIGLVDVNQFVTACPECTRIGAIAPIFEKAEKVLGHSSFACLE